MTVTRKKLSRYRENYRGGRGQITPPRLFYVGVGHACYIVGDGSWSAFLGSSELVVGREQAGVLGPGVKECLDDFFGVLVFGIKGRGLIEIFIEIGFRLFALGFHVDA